MQDISTGEEKKSREGLYLFIVYSAVIVATLWWSGRISTPSLYDRYLAKLEGINLYVSDKSRSEEALSKILSFQPMGNNQAALLLPDRRKLFLVQAIAARPVEIVLKVRNGFFRLHEELQLRITNTNNQNSGLQISEISEHEWGEEFTVNDGDHNRFVYLRPSKKSSIRNSTG